MLRIVATLVAILACVWSATGITHGSLEVVQVAVLARHGHRAPNPPYWQMCPNDSKTRRKYNVNPEDLTEIGFKQMYDLGRWLRERYGIDEFNRSIHYVRAVGEPRILQSAMALSQGVWPHGYGPGGYLPHRTQLVPVFSDLDTHEYVLDDVPCFKRATNDSISWIQNNMSTFLKDPNIDDAIEMLQSLCGMPETLATEQNVSSFVKTVVDGVIFNTDAGLNVLHGKLNASTILRLRNVSVRILLERLYATDAQRTYTAMDFPETLLGAFQRSRSGLQVIDPDDFVHPWQKVMLFVAHREALYAFAMFFDFSFSVTGLAPGEIPVGTALIMELLVDRSTKVHYVRMQVRTPSNGHYTVAIDSCAMPRLCTLDELQSAAERRVNRTGAWRELCNYTEPELDRITGIR